MTEESSTFYGADLAYIHHVGFGEFVESAAREFAQLLIAAGIREGLVVDLGCGSGILARELTSLGYDVLGIDASSPMVDLARVVAPRAGFECGRISDARIPPCRAVFAVGESLSYLPESVKRVPSLRPMFSRIGRALQPGGLLVFDLIARRGGPAMAYRTWQAGKDWAVLADVTEDASSSIVTRAITTFRQEGRGYRRTDERHRVGVYDRTDILKWLHAAGFTAAVRHRYGRVALLPRRLAFIGRTAGTRGARTGA